LSGIILNMAVQKPNPKSTKSVTKTGFNISGWYPLIIVVVSILLYSRVINYQFVKMDDADLIVQNEVFLKHLKNAPKAFTQSTFEVAGELTDNKSYYRPILTLSLMMDAQVKSPKRPATPYHFFNLVYHILACLLLYFFLKKLCKNPELSFALTMLFAVHPVNAHAIAWVLGRNDVLLAIFTLLSFIGLLDYSVTKKTKYLALHLVSFASALFTKESGVLLLLFYFLFMWLWQKDILYFWKNKIIPVIYALITTGWFMARYAVMHGHENLSGNGSMIQTLGHNLPYLFLYIGKLLLPFNLNVMPGTDTLAIVLGLLSLGAIGMLLYFVPDKKKVLFSIIWFFLLLAPTLLVPELPAYEHRDYLPLIGLLFGISQVSFLSAYRFGSLNKTYVLGSLIVMFIIITSIRVPVFENAFTFWEDATDNTPFAALGAVNLGNIYQEFYDNTKSAPKLEEAGTWTKKALEQDSTVLRGNNNYGAYLYLKGKKDEGAVYFQKEIKFHPTSSDPYKNMGIYYREKGEPAKSVYYWEKLISLNHYNLDAYQDLANYYKQIGDLKKSEEYATKGQQLTEESRQKYNKLK
jgi:tetratricopeptide (TPR) repeat protein